MSRGDEAGFWQCPPSYLLKAWFLVGQDELAWFFRAARRRVRQTSVASSLFPRSLPVACGSKEPDQLEKLEAPAFHVTVRGQ